MRIRVFNPAPSVSGGTGWTDARTVIDIVTDDMPSLVESAIGALTTRNVIVHKVLHPILIACRDVDGELVSLVDETARAEETAEHFDLLFGVNVRGPVLALQATLGAMSEGGSVVLIGSIAGAAGVPSFGTYAATKAALRSYARTWTAELAPRGIRVNVVSPGPISTPIYGKLGLDEASLDATAKQIQAQIPLGRLGTPEELATTVLHMTAPESAFIVGTEVIVDGGMSQL